jgi:tetrachloro-p-hydroquinone reductive dehalogenase
MQRTTCAAAAQRVPVGASAQPAVCSRRVLAVRARIAWAMCSLAASPRRLRRRDPRPAITSAHATTLGLNAKRAVAPTERIRQSSPVPAEVVLHHFWPSLCSQKVRLALAEKHVAYRSELVNIGPPMENYKPAYARLNPRMVVPTLVIGDEVITDSARIVVEIDRRFDSPDLGSDGDDVKRWIALQDGLEIREIAYGRRRGLIGFLTKGTFDRRIEVLTAYRDANPDLADLYNARLDDVRRWKEVSSTPAEVDARREKVCEALENVDHALETREFLAGETYSLADVVWTVMLARLKFMGFTEQFGPRTLAYYARMKTRPSFAEGQVWERVKPMVMLPLIARVLAHRLGLR